MRFNLCTHLAGAKVGRDRWHVIGSTTPIFKFDEKHHETETG